MIASEPHCRLLASGVDTSRLKEFCEALYFGTGHQFPDGRFLACRYSPDEMAAMAGIFQDTVAEHIGRPEVGIIWLLRMGPGDELPLHTDHEIALMVRRFPVRLHLVVSAAPGCQFYIANEVIEQREGDLWQISGVTHVLHGARNGSARDRLLAVFDVKDDDGRIRARPSIERPLGRAR